MSTDSVSEETLENTISPEDLAFLKLLKKEVKEPPKGDDSKGLKEWMLHYLATSGELQPKEELKESKTKVIPTPRMRDPPRVSTFSGSNAKGETTYELWRYEVCGLMADKLYDPENITYAVRRSLKGDAGVIAMHLGSQASVVEIIDKLDSIYGAIEKKEDILGQFYRARQGDDESVTKWSCRLEAIIGRAVDRKIVAKKDTNAMLRSMLWSGLRGELKDISGHKYDTINDFDQLRIALRQIEQDQEERRTKRHTAKSAVPTAEATTTNQIDEVRGMIQQLNARFDKWEQRQDRPYNQNTNSNNRSYYQNTSGNNKPKQRRYQNNRRQQPNTEEQTQPTTDTNQNQTRKKIVCYNCGQEGHKKIGCANPPNLNRQKLNFQKPMEQDRH